MLRETKNLWPLFSINDHLLVDCFYHFEICVFSSSFLVTEVLNGICNASKEEDRRRKGTRAISLLILASLIYNALSVCAFLLKLALGSRFLVPFVHMCVIFIYTLKKPFAGFCSQVQDTTNYITVLSAMTLSLLRVSSAPKSSGCFQKVRRRNVH